MAKSDSSDDDGKGRSGQRTNKAIDSQKKRLERLMQNPDKPAHIPTGPKDKPPLPPAEYVRFYMGSSAGAGSGEFHIYRNLRRKEQNRMKYIDDQAKKDKLRSEFEIEADRNRIVEEEKTSKKRAKRLKKKAKQSNKKPKTSETNEESESSSDDEEKDQVITPALAEPKICSETVQPDSSASPSISIVIACSTKANEVQSIDKG